MSLENSDGLYDLIRNFTLKVGNIIRDLVGGAATASSPLYVDSSSKLAVGGFPFALQLLAGVADTSFSVAAVSGSSTGSANELMHQTLVDGATVTTFTKTGFMRVTITDAAGNITNGAHYIQFGTLS